jgi:SAM-dependent methyltransferase
MGELPEINSSKESFSKAEDHFQAGAFDKAAELYRLCAGYEQFAHLCYYRLAQIANMAHEAAAAYDYYYKALETKPDLASCTLPEKHPGRGYVFQGRNNELARKNCPLCGAEGAPYWCYPLYEAAGYSAFFNPIRLWMHCTECDHLFAGDYPEKPFLLNDAPRAANAQYLPLYSRVLERIRRYTDGNALLEVGIGACECALVAKEAGYEVFGIDVIRRHVDAAHAYGLSAETCDFLLFEPAQKWDVIMMGDVLEHVLDPVRAVEKAGGLLNEGGVLWISTPNFASAFSTLSGHNDPMRKQTFHTNYFSKGSLYRLLQRHGLRPADYQVSAHYNGSMEVIAVK